MYLSVPTGGSPECSNIHMGGTASILVASREPVAGVVSLSGPVAFRGLDAGKAIREVKAPILLISAEGDVNAVKAARWMEHNATSPCKLLVVPGPEHGTRMFRGRAVGEVEGAILQFLKSH